MTISTHTTQLRVPQTSSIVPITIEASPIFSKMTAAMKLFRKAMYAESAGRRTTKEEYGISAAERSAAKLWDKTEAAFAAASLLPAASPAEAALARFCAEVAVYLDDADNAAGLDPRKFHIGSQRTSQEASGLVQAIQVLLADYAAALPVGHFDDGMLAA
jgi:hypothetical protein|tara:strand:- start:1379 stop:1858 length:480 start_codon:yes stop_codon:yes gene_type:complete